MKKIHFIGIGGIGLSALARFLKFEGYIVSGSDIKETPLTKSLREEGIEVTIPHSAKAINNQDIVIYSAIIKKDNIEYLEAKRKNILCQSRKEAIKWILKDKKVFAVAGAHGKSTTSAILNSIMRTSMLIGAESKEYKSNMVYKKGSNVIVFEADESDASFLNSNPFMAIVTNAEPEHMECYNYDYERFYNAYRHFIRKAKERVLNAEDDFLSTLDDIEAVRLYPSKDIKEIETIIREKEPYTSFLLKDLGRFEVWGVGKHIVVDASLAILGASNFLDIETIRENIKKYKGIKKRFDIIDIKEDFILIDDYGHHPTEIKATLKSLSIYSKMVKVSPIIAIWQPHKYSRTIDNLEAYKNCFEGVDSLIILPVWKAGEKEVEIDFQKHFQKYNPLFVDSIKKDDATIKLINNNRVIASLEKGVIIGFGAGDISYQLRGLVENSDKSF